LNGRQDPAEIERVGLRLQLRKQQAEAGDIVPLYGDESEALTYPYQARVWARSGADLRVPAPGQAKKLAMLGSGQSHFRTGRASWRGIGHSRRLV